MSIFTKVFMPHVGSNRFDLSHDVKMSFNMGELVPSCVMDVVPGDKFEISTEKMLRFAPLVAPMMHNVDVTCHYFFVPNRILWPNWEDFITGESDSEAPYILDAHTINPGTLGDYLGMPTTSAANGLKINALPVAAYVKIWDEYYRDQNLQNPLFVSLVDGNNINYKDIADDAPLKRAWQHDYFTSCLPFSQKGDEVRLPLLENQEAPVRYNFGNNSAVTVRVASNNDVLGDSNLLLADTEGDVRGRNGSEQPPFAVDDKWAFDPGDTLKVDIAGQESTINTLRRAFRLQEWLEKNARGGTRYIENILAHFGVRSSDKRLQRPEYLGGSRGKMVISEVLSTAQTVDQSSNDVPIGQLAGHGISVNGSKKFKVKIEEHGWIIGLVSVRPTTAYQQGLPRMFFRNDKLDYYWPSFANIGEQAVLNQEVFADNTLAANEGTFGYIPRYSEYKYMNNRVCGDFKDSLSYWHLGRIFAAAPQLNEAFIRCEPDHRVFAVTDPNEHKIWAHIFNNIQAIRKMPKFGVPTI